MRLDEIKLLPDTTDQLVNIELGGNPYTLRVLWNESAGYFSLSVFELEGAVILENIKMVKNYPLIGRFKDDRLPIGDLYFIDNKNKNARPLYESIGTGDYSLMYYEPDIIETSKVVVTPTAAVSGSIYDSGLSVWDSGATTWD